MITPKKQIDYAPLYDMLTYKRPADSRSEKAFIKKYIDTIPGIRSDPFGNRILQLGGTPSTLFSAHTDTVHSKGGKQKIIVDEIGGYIYKDDGDPLGADDATGIFIMLQLIAAKIPGLYIFHRQEEIGGLGSDYIANDTPQLLDGIDRAIAFDRKLDCSVITYQSSGRCCSDNFARALASAIGGDYAPDDTGMFTDTANYTSLIAECTNLSVGYCQEHTKNETQDLKTLDFLIPALLAINWDMLPTDRDPSIMDPDSMAWGSSWQDSGINKEDLIAYGFDDYDAALDLCHDNPDQAAMLLIEAYGTIYGDAMADDTAADTADADNSADDQIDLLRWFDNRN